MFDDTLARQFQQRYLEGEREAMAGLYAECRCLAEGLARSYAYIRGIQITTERTEDVAALATSRILSRFKSGTYTVRSFYRTINTEVVHELSRGGPKARLLAGFVSLETVPEPTAPEQHNGHEGREIVEDLLQEAHGKRIFFDLALYRTFRDACISIAGYVTADRILTESRKLREIHRVLHREGVRK